MSHKADVDIDLANRNLLIDLINCTPASLANGKKHNSGVYVQPIPINPFTGNASISYKEADNRGYFKLDLLNVLLYNEIKDNEHYEKLLNTEPPWERLAEEDFVKQLIHIGGHYKEVKKMMPDTIPRLAMFISIIRPGKKHLMYKPWNEIAKTVWEKDENDEKYSYKKSHAISYAVLVALHMNIINE